MRPATAFILTSLLLTVVGCARSHVESRGTFFAPPERTGRALILADDTDLATDAAIHLQRWIGWAIVERAAVDQVLAEQRFQLRLTREREADALGVGQMAGADQVVFIGHDGEPHAETVTIRSVSVQTGVLLWAGRATVSWPAEWEQRDLYGHGWTPNRPAFARRALWWAIVRALCPPERFDSTDGCPARS